MKGLMIIFCIQYVASWQLKHIDIITAKTTIRLWHELHCSKKESHDFAQLISPEKKQSQFYIASINHDEIRAIGLCERENLYDVYLTGIAYPPDNLDSSTKLIRMMNDNTNTSINYVKLKTQTRLYCEALLLCNF